MKYLYVLIFLFICQWGHSQSVTHGYMLSKDSLIIGDNVDLIYTLSASSSDVINAVDFSSMDSLKSLANPTDSTDYFADVEWDENFESKKIKKLGQELFVNQNGKYTFRDTFNLTFWDYGVYQMRLPVLYYDTSSTLNISELQAPFLLVDIPRDVVNTDTTTVLMPIADIIPEEKSFLDYLWVLYILGIGLLLFLGYWFYKRREEKESIPIPDPVILPAHITALSQLSDLREKALWKSDRVKEHQSTLTHIIREYLENRFGINALESTTDQILKALKTKNFSLAHENDLRDVLQIADMVKFAKAKPPLEINDAFVEKAIAFVKDTQVQMTLEEEQNVLVEKKKYDAIMSKINKKAFFLLTLPIGDYEFQHPLYLLLLLLLPLMWYWKYRIRTNSNSRMSFPHVGSIENIESIKSKLVRYLPILRYVGLAALILALARPRLVLKEEEVKAEGIDIMLVMDLSSSMLARDFSPDRLTVSKEMGKNFIDKRPYDRIGLVVFAGESFTQSPLTTDHRIVKEFLTSLESGMLEDGTAIGMGLASAVNRLKSSESKSKIVILLTDGVSNAGYIKPMTAAEIAKEIDVKVYTIGVGSMGEAISPISRRSDGRYVFGVSRVEIDEELLTEISELTGGKYFRATNEIGLEQIYDEIDRLEKTEIEVSVFKRYSEEFRKFLVIGLCCLALEWLLGQTMLRTLP